MTMLLESEHAPLWAVWNVAQAPCCGRATVHVYPAGLDEIECDCGEWLATPRYSPHGRRIDLMLVSVQGNGAH
jgi:hypothetical protein